MASNYPNLGVKRGQGFAPIQWYVEFFNPQTPEAGWRNNYQEWIWFECVEDCMKAYNHEAVFGNLHYRFRCTNGEIIPCEIFGGEHHDVLDTIVHG